MNKIQNEVIDFNNKKTVQANDLITSVAKMDKIPLKIFELAVSCIDVENPPEDNSITLSKKKLFTFFDVDDSNRHSRFKQAIEQMQKQAYFEIKEVKGKGFVYESIVPIPYVRWNDFSDEVKIRFDQAIMPYLIDLKENFTQYLISDIMYLESKYSVVLYKWLSMNYNQFEYYENTASRTKKQLDNYKNPMISIGELRRITDTVDEYSRFDNFESRVLKTAFKEINEHTTFNIAYEKIKSGRSISEIQFHITKKRVAENDYYKEEQADPYYLKGKEEKKVSRTEQYLAAKESKYTDMLAKNSLITVMDVLDEDIMITFNNLVYPLYDKLGALRGDEGVMEHMSYVKEKMDQYSKPNIAKYMLKAIKDYLHTVELRDKIARLNN